MNLISQLVSLSLVNYDINIVQSSNVESKLTIEKYQLMQEKSQTEHKLLDDRIRSLNRESQLFKKKIEDLEAEKESYQRESDRQTDSIKTQYSMMIRGEFTDIFNTLLHLDHSCELENLSKEINLLRTEKDNLVKTIKVSI